MIGETIQTVKTGIAGISRYGNITLSTDVGTLRECGFEPADMIRVKIGGCEMEMPVGISYNDADSGEPVCVFLEDAAGGGSWVVLSINAGSMASAMGIAEIRHTGEGPGYELVWFEGIDGSAEVYISMAEKQGFAEEYRMHRLGKTRTNDREDYPGLTDEEYANFREIKTTGIAPGILFRSSSPVNPALNRNREADEALAKAGIKTVVNMTDSDERMKKYPGFFLTAYSGCDIICLDMEMDFFSKGFRRRLAAGFRFLASHEGPYLIHCSEGKDRVGFAAALLECLMGADVDEIVQDYMRSFTNYYGIGPDSEQYSEIAAGNIIVSLARALRNGPAERYLARIGMNGGEIEKLRERLRENTAAKQEQKGKV